MISSYSTKGWEKFRKRDDSKTDITTKLIEEYTPILPKLWMHPIYLRFYFQECWFSSSQNISANKSKIQKLTVIWTINSINICKCHGWYVGKRYVYDGYSSWIVPVSIWFYFSSLDYPFITFFVENLLNSRMLS